MTHTIWLLRARPQLEDLAFLLEEEGLAPRFVPVLDALAPEDPRALGSAVEQLQRFAFLAPDAPRAVRAVVERAHAAATSPLLRRVRWLCADEDTARAVAHSGFSEQLAAPGRADAWGDLLGDEEEEVLGLHEAQGPADWQQALRHQRGGVTLVQAWRRGPELELALGLPDVVVVHSPLEAEAAWQALPQARREGVRFVAAGPVTATALRELGARVCAVATSPAADGVLDATLRALLG